MFAINEDKSIYITRGDIASIEVSALDPSGEPHTFQPGDLVRIQVFDKKNVHNVKLSKGVLVEEATTAVEILLETEDTRYGELVHKPTDYWYEITINPYTAPQTIVGYDVDGPKIFRLFPEGRNLDE